MSKKLIIFISSYILCFILIIILINNSYKKDNIDRIEYNYDSLYNGEVIPFNSRIKGEIYTFGIFTHDHKEFYYYTKLGHIQNFIKACYCKDDTCLKKDKCDKALPLLELGEHNTFTFDVDSYKNLFGTNNYTGWKIYYKPIDYRKIYEEFSESFVGTYYDLYFIPTSDSNNEVNNIKYYKNIDYKITSNDYKENNNIYELYDEGVYSIKFSTNKGDIITFDIKTSDDNLEILLNDKNINKDIKLDNDIKTNKNNSIYITKIYEIKDDNEYELKFITKKNKNVLEKNYVNYYKYTYLKNINILSEDKNNKDKYIIYNDNEYIVGDYNE